MSIRREHDFYPSDPRAIYAFWHGVLAHHPELLEDGVAWHDPAGGYGGFPMCLSEIIKPDESLRMPKFHLSDIQPELRPCLQLNAHGGDVRIGDSLDPAYRWPTAHRPSNTPFGDLLESFAERMHQYARADKTFAALLVRVQWPDDGNSRWMRFDPDEVWRMDFRLDCKGDGKSDSTTHCFLVWRPRPRRKGEARASRVLRQVKVPMKIKMHHARMARSAKDAYASYLDGLHAAALAWDGTQQSLSLDAPAERAA